MNPSGTRSNDVEPATMETQVGGFADMGWNQGRFG